ncbi:sensor histidine kinase [Phaeobacter gallaeciensis]|uniref:sensor histidine kinase n=1 Tax=Phaeobacter gallaeciensis TaxID=60890 RepID=UPI00237FD36E|nr:ATP-binding protein [Phaeobacter gallaeciensis]MDE4100010.1 ATP-binding protein [Phaeobacter gallaeciensis]MDE4108798.1 ATP-binding protein [Phaeobacter gallaeciensis]MDE4113244.1 ATP-binding protein [Phaeobacter gallaeciensis]MDE4117685.1 ATP-binding protein [Phaeobacter gallaeciensis]MDE4122188.1 ATP-binding protein [Phaeobacter gallaeciensis]
MPSTVDNSMKALGEDAWKDVIAAMDRTYSELVEYQERLEKQNRELDDLRQFMNSVLSSVSDMLLVVAKDGFIERTGGAIRTILGKDLEADSGTHLTELLEKADRNPLPAAIEHVMLTREPTMLEAEFSTGNGPTPLEISVSPRLDQRGRSRGVVLVGRPLGELRSAYSELEASHIALQQAQTQLVRNEKLASLGRLVAGVAHELNNPISFVYANTHALEKYTERFETYFKAVQDGQSRRELAALREELKLDKTVRNLRAAIDGAKDGAERVRDIVEDLRRLSAEGASEPVSFDLMTTTRTAADWVVRASKARMEISFADLSGRRVRGNPGHVQQIVMNLVQNAVDALSETERPALRLCIEERGDAIVLQVIDNGPGIPDDIAASVFDPFFTTKPVGKGTGLGLSISHKIAEEQGGSLVLAASGPEGCCFELHLPTEEVE